jgi:hypothetical protein
MPNQAVVLNVPNEGQAGRCDRTVTTVPDPQQRTVFQRVGAKTPSKGGKWQTNAVVYQFGTGLRLTNIPPAVSKAANAFEQIFKTWTEVTEKHTCCTLDK